MLQESESFKSEASRPRKVVNTPCENADDVYTLSKSSIGRQGALVVDPKLKECLHDHQKDGVCFLWKNCFADCEDESKSAGGAIVAHYMGTGKSLLTITLLHSVMTQPCLLNGKSIKSVLMLVPTNTLSNWENELYKWTAGLKRRIRMFNVGKVSSHYRKAELKIWKEEGGILLMNEKLFLNKNQSDFVLKHAQPEVLVLDEAHTMLKNANTLISKLLIQIATKRKILLTGTPLQV